MKSLKYIIFSSLVLMAFKTSENKSQYIIPYKAQSVCTSDIDFDNDMDIITGHRVVWGDTNKSISVLENIDNGLFAVKDTSKSFCGYQENIFTIRVDDDSLPDLIVLHGDFTNGLQRYIRVFYNNDGNYDDFTDFNLNSDETFSFINHGKINNDEYDDIVVCSNNGHLWGILYNDGAGGFTDPQYYDVDWPPTDIACGDLNMDGLDDIIVAGQNMVAFYSTENGFVYDSVGYQQFLVHLADLDKDGDNDIVCFNEISSYTMITMIENLGYGFYITYETTYYNPNCSHFIISDLNNDSLPDLIGVQIYSGLYLFYNEGDFNLANPEFIQIPEISYGDHLNVTSDDMDDNGFNDLVVIGTGAHLNLLFNDGQGNFVVNPITGIENPIPKIQNPIITCSPNPFKTSTQFSFNLKDESRVAIIIYDHNGKKEGIINPGLMPPGNHSLEFNSANLPSGIYFYSLELNGIKTDTKKMTLMR